MQVYFVIYVFHNNIKINLEPVTKKPFVWLFTLLNQLFSPFYVEQLMGTRFVSFAAVIYESKIFKQDTYE
jgi:hypothetical protein